MRNYKRQKKKLHFSPLHISSGIDFGVLEGNLGCRNLLDLVFWNRSHPPPQKYDFTLKLLMNITVSYWLCVTLCTYVQLHFSTGLCVWLTTFISTKVPCKFKICWFYWRFHRNRENTMTSVLEKWGQSGRFLQLCSWICSSLFKLMGPSE